MLICLLVLWAVVRADEFDDIDGDPYDLLGVPYDASEEAVKKAYRSLSRRWHPDKNPTNTRKATKQFAKLSRAYEIVNDRKSRRRFDAHARMRAGSPPPAFDFDNLKTSFFGAKKEDLPPGTKRTMFERGGFRSVGHVDERFVPSWTKRGTRKMTRVTTTTLPTGTVLAEAQDYELRNGEWYETSKPYAWHGPDEGGASGETSRLEPARALFLGDKLVSPDGSHAFALEIDGNARVRETDGTHRVIWETGVLPTAAAGGDGFVLLQRDGNLLLCSGSSPRALDSVLWSSNSADSTADGSLAGVSLSLSRARGRGDDARDAGPSSSSTSSAN